MEEAQNADRVIVMKKGSIVADGSPTEIFAMTDVLEDSGLALPQTTELLTLLKNNGLNVNNGFISPQATADEIFSVISGR